MAGINKVSCKFHVTLFGCRVGGDVGQLRTNEIDKWTNIRENGKTDLSGTSRANGFYYFHAIIPLHTDTAVTHFILKSTNAVQEHVNHVLLVQRNILYVRTVSSN